MGIFKSSTLIISLILISCSLAIAEVPHILNLQGFLVDENGPVTGQLEATFRIYDTETGGSPLWEETDSVIVEAGIYSQILGLVIPMDILFTDQRWIGVQFTGHAEMTPRFRQTSVPFAFVAKSSDSSGTVSDDAITGSKILSGTIELSDIGSNGALPGQIIKWNGSAWEISDDLTGSGSGGNGWVDNGNSVGLENSTDSVGIGISIPTEKLDVDGNLKVSGKATIGANNINLGAGGFVAGSSNSAIADGVTISGGSGNDGGGSMSVIGGGVGNYTIEPYSTIGGGFSNEVGGGTGTIAGGRSNVTVGNYNFIGGGQENQTDGIYSSLSGGWNNGITGDYGTIGGGRYDTTHALYGGVFSGYGNLGGSQLSDTGAFVGGGFRNYISGPFGVIGGGKKNFVGSYGGAVVGGICDSVKATYGGVASGFSNMAGNNSADTGAFIGGGSDNSVLGKYGIIGGGQDNIIWSNYSSILGGSGNTIFSGAHYSQLFGLNSSLTKDSTYMVDFPHIRFGSEANGYEFPTTDGTAGQTLTTDGTGQLSWGAGSGGGGGWADNGNYLSLENSGDSVGIGTLFPREKLEVTGNLLVTGKANIGFNNSTGGGNSFVAGNSNSIGGAHSSITGGMDNQVLADFGSIGGGEQNQTTSRHAFVGSGRLNIAGGIASAIGGGWQNYAGGEYSAVGGGYRDSVLSHKSGIFSGHDNIVGANVGDSGSFIGGGGGNMVLGRYSTIAGGQNNLVDDDYGTVAGGADNIAGITATVGGGAGNEALASGSTIPGGGQNFVGGMLSLAAGFRAKVTHQGSFVWADFRQSDFPSTANNQIRLRAANGVEIADQNGVSTIVMNPTLRKITINSAAGAPIVEIGDGLDYAEVFPTSLKDIDPGTVMIIDVNNPGKLTTSNSEYDKKVTGIIAGAKGLGSGVKLGRIVNVGDQPVALAGRVYCKVDASYGAVEPGDLLTTSPTPGYAMVVTDFSRAHGTILGKAMERMAAGEKGKILVLVTLQ